MVFHFLLSLVSSCLYRVLVSTSQNLTLTFFSNSPKLKWRFCGFIDSQPTAWPQCELWKTLSRRYSLYLLQSDCIKLHRVVLKIQPCATEQRQTVITVCFNLSSLSLFLLHCGGAELIGNKCPFWNWSCKGRKREAVYLALVRALTGSACSHYITLQLPSSSSLRSREGERHWTKMERDWEEWDWKKKKRQRQSKEQKLGKECRNSDPVQFNLHLC